MRGALAVLAEIARSAHDPRTEVMLPDAVHHRARGQRVIRARDPFCEAQAPAARRELPVAIGFEHCRLEGPRNSARETGPNGLAALIIVPANQEARRSDARARG